jgi:phosphoribosyl 1,2-cyclic phosphodiesterase
MLYIASLNSGSNGNCYYVGNSDEAILVDAGLSCRETEKRMKRAGLSLQKVKAIFISHEHSDHIRGVEVIAKKFRIPVYITAETFLASNLVLEDPLLKLFRTFDTISVGGLTITPFAKEHDASDPHSFTVEGNGVTIGIFTDIGTACENVVRHFRRCHAIFLEANYDEEMLEKGAYPFYLKKRIRSDKGHLSNLQALELFRRHRPEFMSHILLSHLSKDNNHPDLARELFQSHAGEVMITVASRDEESPVYRVEAFLEEGKWKSRSTVPGESIQASLF